FHGQKTALAANEAWPAEKRAQILLAVIDGAKRFPPWATDRQQLGRPDDRHADGSAGRAVGTCAAAAETRGGEAAIGPALEVDRPARAVAARAVDVHLKAKAADVADGLEWKRAKHGTKRNAVASRESLS